MQSPLRAMYKLNFLYNIRVENWCRVRILPEPSFWFNYMGRCAIAYTFQKCSVRSAEKITRIFDLFIYFLDKNSRKCAILLIKGKSKEIIYGLGPQRTKSWWGKPICIPKNYTWTKRTSIPPIIQKDIIYVKN